MKFRLKLGPFELSIETPEPVQVSPTDLVTALWSAQAQMMGDMLVREDEAEE
ncbi:hypothetical protein [Nocardia farcinica]|uniref:Uncharacterized protein n=1 Tax=Nocardia farcinica (strain IFM 10152) TaxID=247156 RepID=Q5YSQ5_NOCFA|nr:hypothetical protein [Nocardia farcinica]BAD58786.1 hypothetical protein NFA_39380 [Nocardia farcinica IFM 10152]